MNKPDENYQPPRATISMLADGEILAAVATIVAEAEDNFQTVIQAYEDDWEMAQDARLPALKALARFAAALKSRRLMGIGEATRRLNSAASTFQN